MDVTPRISILEPPPADPADLVICTPAALPTKASSALLDPEFLFHHFQLLDRVSKSFSLSFNTQ